MLFFRSSPTVLCLQIADHGLRAAVVRVRGKKTEMLETVEEPLPDGVIRGGMVENLQAAGETLIALLKKCKHGMKKAPVYISLPPSHTYTAFIEGLPSMPKNKGLLADLASQWLPFSPEEAMVKYNWQQGVPPALTMTAIEQKLIKGYRMLTGKADLKSPVLVPRSYGLLCLAFGNGGAKKPSIFLDLTASTPVMTLAVGQSIVDERVLFGDAPSEAYCETILTWIPRVLGQTTIAQPPKTDKERKKEEKERLKEEKRKEKEEEKKAKAAAKEAKKNGGTAPVKNTAAKIASVTDTDDKMKIEKPQIPTLDMEKDVAVPIVVFGDESHPFDVSCRKLKNVSVVTTYVSLDEPAFAYALAAAHPSLGSLPTFS